MIKIKKSNFKAFLVFWALDALILYFARILYPSFFMLGTAKVSVWVAVLVAGFVWTIVVWLSVPFIELFTKIKGRVLMFGFYFLANFAGLWLTARLAPVSGFGAKSFVWLTLLALIADILQYLVWKTGGFKKAVK